MCSKVFLKCPTCRLRRAPPYKDQYEIQYCNSYYVICAQLRSYFRTGKDPCDICAEIKRKEERDAKRRDQQKKDKDKQAAQKVDRARPWEQ